MKLHLPLRLLAALLAVLAVNNTAWGAVVTVSGSSVTLNPKEYSDGLQVTATDEGRVIMDSASTTVVGSIGISLSGSSSFTMERGTLGNGASSPVTLDMLTGSSFQMGGSGVLPVLATGRGNVTSINLSDSTFTMLSGTVATSGAELTLNIGSGALFDLRNGTVSNGSYLSQNTEGGVSFVHTTAVINVNNGGQFVMGSAGNIGYAGGGAVVHVNSGGVFTQNGGLMGFARGAEGGRVEMQVHDGGVYRMKGGNIAASNARSRVTVESGGVFELGGTVTKNESGDVITRTSGKISAGSGTSGSYTDIVVKSGGVFNMSDGSIASVPTAGDGEVYIQLNGTFNQSGGDVATGNGKALIRVQNGGSYVQSGGSIGLSNGTAALEVQRGGSYTLKGGGSISGHVEVALGYATELTVSYKGSSNLWPDEVTPEAPAESGSYTFVQEGGVVDGYVSIGIVGADASYTQSGGEIGGNVSISVSGGANFELNGEGEIIGQASVTIGSGSSFVMSGGAIAEGASLIFNGASFVQSSGSIGGGAGDHVSITLIGGTHTQSGGSMALAEGDALTLNEGAVFAQSSGGSISGGSLSLSGKGTRFSSDGGSIVGTDITLAEGTSMSLSGSTLSGSISAEAAEVEQSGGQVLADVSITDGAHYTQKDNAAVQGDISIENAEWVMEGGSIVHGSAIGVAEGGSFTQKGGSIDASIAVTSGSFEQNGFVSGDITVQGAGSTYTQKAGNIMDGSSVSVADGAHFTQESGDIDADIQVSDGAQLGLAGTVTGKVSADASSMELQVSGSITGDVELSHGAELTQAGSISGNVSLSDGSSLKQANDIGGSVVANASTVVQTSGSIAGDVELSHGAELTQVGSIGGNVSLSDGSSLKQANDIGGSVVADASKVVQTSGNIVGDVELKHGAELTQVGSIGGNVTLSDGSSLKQANDIGGSVVADASKVVQTSGNIAGDVELSHGASLTQVGSIGGNVVISGSSIVQQTGADIVGNVTLSDRSEFTQMGDIGGNVAVSSGSAFSRRSGEVKGSIMVNSTQLTYGDGNVGGGVQVSNKGVYSQGNGFIGGEVVVTDSTFTHGSGDIRGRIVGKNATLTHGGGDIAGTVELSGSTLTLSKDADKIGIQGDVSLVASSKFMGGVVNIAGGVTAENSSFSMEAAEILGQVELTASSFLSNEGNISGNVRAERGSTFKLAAGSIGGSVVVNASTFTISGDINYGVEVSNGSQFYQLVGGDISGAVSVSASKFTQGATIYGSVSVTEGSVYDMQGEYIHGTVSVDASTFTQMRGIIGEAVTLSHGASYTQVGGEIAAGVTLSGGAQLSFDGTIEGSITVENSTVEQKENGIAEDDVLLTNSTLIQSGMISGNVSSVGSELTLAGTILGGVAAESTKITQQRGAIAGNVKLSGKSSFTMEGGSIASNSSEISLGAGDVFTQKGGAIGGAVVELENATFIRRGGSMTADVTMNGGQTLLDLGSKETRGSITLHGGALKGAAIFLGSLVVDTAADYTSAIDLGNVRAESVKNVITRTTSSVINNIGAGVLTFADAGNVLLVGTDTSDAQGTPKHALLNFSDSAGIIAFEDSGSVTLNFSANVLKDAKTRKDGEKNKIRVNFTNGMLSGLPAEETALNAWLAQHFVTGSGLVTEEDVKEGYGWVDAEGGSITLHVNLDYIWISSADGDVSDSEWDIFSKNRMVIVDEDLRIDQRQSGDIVINQLSSGGDHAGNLYITANQASTIELVNNETVEGSGNGDTYFNGDIIIDGANATDSVLKKTGTGALFVGGSIAGAGTLSIEQGSLTLNGKDSNVGSLQLAENTTLNLNGSLLLNGKNGGANTLQMGNNTVINLTGSLSLNGDSDIASGVLKGGGELTQGAGTLMLGEAVEVAVNLTLGQGATVKRAGDVNGNVTLSGKDASFEHTGSGLGTIIEGNLTLSGEGAKYVGSSDITVYGAVELSGAGSSAKGIDEIIGGASLLGAQTALEVGSVTGDVVLSGDGATFKGSGDVNGNVNLSGKKVSFVGKNVVGDVMIAGDGASFTAENVVGMNVVGSDAVISVKLVGPVILAGDRSTLESQLCSGDVMISGSQAEFKSGLVEGDITIEGADAKADIYYAYGDITLAGAGSWLIQHAEEGDVLPAGNVTLSGRGAGMECWTLMGSVLMSGDDTHLIIHQNAQMGQMLGVQLLGAGALMEAGGHSVQGDILISGKGAAAQKVGAVSGSVALDGDEAAFTGGDVVGNVSISGAGASYIGKQVGGVLTITGDNAQFTGGDVAGSVSISGAGASYIGKQVGGMLTITGDNAQFTGGEVRGEVILSGRGVQAEVQGDVDGAVQVDGSKTICSISGHMLSVNISGADTRFTQGGSVGGDILVSGNGVTYIQQGAVDGNIALSGNEVSYTQQGGVSGNISLNGNGVTYAQQGGVSGDISLKGIGASYTQQGDVGGNIVLSGEGVTYEHKDGQVDGGVQITAANVHYMICGGGIAGDVLLNGAGAVLDMGNTAAVQGGIMLQAGSLLNAGAYAGAGVVINTADTLQGALKLGGLQAGRISSVNTGLDTVLTELADGSTLNFSGVNAMYAGKSNASYGRNVASEAMIQYDGSGAVSFADGGQLKLRFSSELVRDFGSGKMEIWLTNGAIMGMPEDEEALLAWLQEHILLATGSGMEYSLESGEFSGAHDGWLTISASSSDIWKTSEWDSTVKNPGAFNSFSKVDIDDDTTLLVEEDEPSHTILRQLEGDHDLNIINTGAAELIVEFNNKNVLGYYGETTYSGDITVEGVVIIEKTGDADLTLAGNLKTPGRVDVKEGKLILNGVGNEIGSITLGEKLADGSFTAGVLEVNGAVKLTGESDLRDSLGSISGVGLLAISGNLLLGEGVSLNGPSVQLEDGGTLNLNGTQASITGLNGTGTLHLGDGGALTVSGSGSFSGTLAGSGVLSTAGKGSSLSLVGSGNVNYDLVVGANTSLSLSREVQPVAVRAASAGQEITYHSVTNAGTLQVLGAEGHTSLIAVGDITLSSGSITEIALDIAAPASAALASTGGKVIIENGAMISLGLVGKPTGGELKVTLISSAEGVYDESGALWSAGADMPNVSFNEAIFDLLYDHVNVEVGEDSKTVTLTATQKVENELIVVADTRNSQAGADLLFEALKVADLEENPTLRAAGNSIVEMLQAGEGAAAARVQAAMAGSTVTALGAAQRDALREQLLHTRDRSASLMYGESTRKVVYTPKVYTSIEAMGGYSKLSADGDESGYKLNTWGGSVSAETHIKHSLHVGLALSALYGDLDAEAADTATGSLDSYYVNLYMRGTAGKWSHSVVVTLGMNSAELDRTVNYGAGSYTTHGSTDGVGAGALYEVAYDIALNAERSSILQPLLNFAVVSTSMKGYEEQGADGAGLRVDDQSWTTASVGFGVRWAGRVSPAFFGRGAWAELRLNVAQDVGDTSGSADVAMLANPALSRTVYGAEVGSTAIQLGAGVSVPVSAGAGGAVIYLNGTSDFRSGASSWNVSAGLRMGF